MAGLGLMNRRRAIASSPTLLEVDINSYVADSIVLWHDGIEKGNTEGVWTDLAGQNHLTNYGAISTENGWYFQGADTSFMRWLSTSSYISWSPISSNGVGRTMEIVVAFEGNTHVEYVFTQNTGGIAFGRSSDKYIIVGNGVSLRTAFVNPYKLEQHICHFSCSFNPYLAWDNGVELSTAADDYLYAERYVGRAPSAGRSFKGTIYAIRIHDRVLTEEELAHNRKIDSIRFGLEI